MNKELKQRVEVAINIDICDDDHADVLYEGCLGCHKEAITIIKELTEREVKLIALAKLVAGIEPEGDGNEYSMNDTGILIRCNKAAKATLSKLGE